MSKANRHIQVKPCCTHCKHLVIGAFLVGRCKLSNESIKMKEFYIKSCNLFTVDNEYITYCR